jgi:hypothetical protein
MVFRTQLIIEERPVHSVQNWILVIGNNTAQQMFHNNECSFAGSSVDVPNSYQQAVRMALF